MVTLVAEQDVGFVYLMKSCHHIHSGSCPFALCVAPRTRVTHYHCIVLAISDSYT